jgi:serine/threonine protein phosphatase PrpC
VSLKADSIVRFASVFLASVVIILDWRLAVMRELGGLQYSVTTPGHLDKGDILVVYSDGLTDAENPQEEMFGEKRLLEIIQRQGPSGSDAVERGFLKAIEDFTQGMPQTDDITFAVVEKCQVPLVLGDSHQRCHRIRADSIGTDTPERWGITRAV